MSFRPHGVLRKAAVVLPLMSLPLCAVHAQTVPTPAKPVVPPANPTTPAVPPTTPQTNPTTPPATPPTAPPTTPPVTPPATAPATKPPEVPAARTAAGEDLSHYDGHTIASVTVTGTAPTNPDIVLGILNSNGIHEGEAFSSASAAAAKVAILSQGLYSDVYATPTLLASGQVALSYQIYTNPIVKIIHVRTSVPLKGKNVPTEASIIDSLASKKDNVLNINNVRADARKVQERYRAAGYDAFLSELDDVFNSQTQTLTFTVTITTINSIKFTGLHKTKEFVLLREMKSKVGDPINQEQIHKDTTHIFATNLFSDVGNPSIDPVEEGKANLVIPVTEQRTGNVQVGFGYSPEQRLTGTLQISENNFRGRGEGISASWTVGGVVARSQFDLGYTQPWLDKHHTSMSISLYDHIDYLFNRVFTSAVTSGTSSNPYYNERKGAALTFARPISEDTRVLTTLRTEAVTANNLFTNDQTLTNDELSNIQGSLVQDGQTNSISFGTLTNTKDNDRDPSTGLYFAPQIEVGVSRFHYQNPYLNPDYISGVKTPDITRVLSTTQYNTGPFTKLSVDFRRYFNLGQPRVGITDPRRVLAMHFLVGTANGNIGFSEQYFIGGADNLRGFADERFWGNHLFLWSTELRMPLADKGVVTGVLFIDVGDAWGASLQNRENVSGFEQHLGFAPHIGYGPGIRITTPVGPVRLDYGISNETARTHFSIGQAF